MLTEIEHLFYPGNEDLQKDIEKNKEKIVGVQNKIVDATNLYREESDTAKTLISNNLVLMAYFLSFSLPASISKRPEDYQLNAYESGFAANFFGWVSEAIVAVAAIEFPLELGIRVALKLTNKGIGSVLGKVQNTGLGDGQEMVALKNQGFFANIGTVSKAIQDRAAIRALREECRVLEEELKELRDELCQDGGVDEGEDLNLDDLKNLLEKRKSALEGISPDKRSGADLIELRDIPDKLEMIDSFSKEKPRLEELESAFADTENDFLEATGATETSLEAASLIAEIDSWKMLATEMAGRLLMNVGVAVLAFGVEAIIAAVEGKKEKDHLEENLKRLRESLDNLDKSQKAMNSLLGLMDKLISNSIENYNILAQILTNYIPVSTSAPFNANNPSNKELSDVIASQQELIVIFSRVTSGIAMIRNLTKAGKSTEEQTAIITQALNVKPEDVAKYRDVMTQIDTSTGTNVEIQKRLLEQINQMNFPVASKTTREETSANPQAAPVVASVAHSRFGFHAPQDTSTVPPSSNNTSTVTSAPQN